MIDFGTAWPYALAAVLLLALIIIVLLVVVLRRSAKASTFVDAEEPAAAPAAEEESQLDEEIVVSVPEAFRRARSTLRRLGGDRYDVPLFVVAGGEKARDAGMFANAGLDLPWGDAAEAGMHLGAGRGFWFFNRGVLLDLASSDDDEWASALKHLRELRPKRAADGVIVAFPCADLIEASTNEIKRSELAATAGRLFRRLWEAQQQIGFRLPVYVLVTGSERLTGFTSLCSSVPEESRREILGWSSPYSVDAAYRGTWVDEAFTALGRRVDDVQMEIFAAGTTDAEWLLRFPEAVASLAQPVRVCLDNLLKSTAYQGALIFRGLYFCGREGDGKRVAFLPDLVEKKIFLENGLATPTGRTVTARNRAVRVAQIAAAVIGLACAGALAWAQISFAHQDAVLEPFLQSAAQKLRTQSEEKAEAESSHAAMDLLDTMSNIDFRNYGSVFVPSSWFSDFDDRLTRAIGVAFNDVVFSAVDRGLRRKADQILTGSTFHVQSADAPAASPANDGMTETAALAALPIVTNDQLPEFLELKRYVEGMRALDDHIMIFNRLAKAGSGDLQDLGEVVKYALDQSLPVRFYQKGELYQRALRAADYRDFNRDPYVVRSRQALDLLTANFYAALYRRNPFEARLQQLSAALDTNQWRRPTGEDAARLAEIGRRFHALDTALSGPELEWMFRPGNDFNLGAPFNALLPQIERSKFLGPPYAQRVRDAGLTGWRAFRSNLAAAGSPLTGPFLVVRDGNPQMRLSEDSLLLEHALDSFGGQQFVVARPQGRELVPNPSRGVRVVWNASQLDEAMGVASAYDRFREKSLTLFPQDLRVSIDQVARDRARTEMGDFLAAACDYVPVPPASGPTMIEEQLRGDLTAFGGYTESLQKLLEASARLGGDDEHRGVPNIMTTEALRLLREVDDLLDAEQPYRPRFGNFGWWDGAAAPTPAAWGAKDANDVNAYAEATRSRIALLARNYAQPLLMWFTKAGTIDRPDVRPLAQRWQGILDDLRDYDAKKPGNAVAAIEDYIGPRMAKVSAADCSAAILPADVRTGTRYYAQALQQLSKTLVRRCNDLSATSALARYNELSNYFNQRLADRYPFSDWPLRAGTLEADPAAVRMFFRKFDAAKSILASTTIESDPVFAQVKQFLADMSAVRTFFAPFLDAQKPADLTPAFDVEAVFRTARQQEVDADQIIAWSLGVGNEEVTSRDRKPVLRWSFGKPVTLTLRWANDAPRVPASASTARAVSVQDRKVVYRYTNQWALLSALADNAASPEMLPHYDEEEPVTLGFRVFTRPLAGGDPGNVPTQVFMRVGLLAPGTSNPMTLPHFPRTAPKVERAIAEVPQ